MNVYMIYLAAPDPLVTEAIKHEWPAHYVADQQMHFVQAPAQALSKSVHAALTNRLGRQVRSVILPVRAYFGYHDKALWEWLDRETSL